MENFIPALIMGFREGLEAFLIMVVIFQFLNKSNMGHLKKFGNLGLISGLLGSLLIGGILYLISNEIGRTEQTAQLWASATSIIALALVTIFIYWMMHSGRTMVSEIHNQVTSNLSAVGIYFMAFVLVAREGAEVAIFTFAGEYHLLPVFVGLILSGLLAIGIYFSLFRINLKVLFTITLGYLILQAGYLLGYGIHEASEALEGLGYVSESSWFMQKAFNLSETIWYHKEGILGLPLHVLFGWYSKPEWTQLIAHYGYVIVLFGIWSRTLRTSK